MKRGLAAGVAVVAAAAPLATAVVQAQPAAADVAFGYRSYVWDPSPTFTADYQTCEFLVGCFHNYVPWFMNDTSDYKAYSNGAFVFWNDHFFLDQKKIAYNAFLQPDGTTLDRRWNENDQEIDTWANANDECAAGYGDWIICQEGKNEDLRAMCCQLWHFAGVGYIQSADPANFVGGDFYRAYWFKG